MLAVLISPICFMPYGSVHIRPPQNVFTFPVRTLAAAALASFHVRQPASVLSVLVVHLHIVLALPLFLCPSGAHISTRLLLDSLSWCGPCPLNFHRPSSLHLIAQCPHASSPLWLLHLAYFPYMPEALVMERASDAIISFVHFPCLASIPQSCWLLMASIIMDV